VNKHYRNASRSSTLSTRRTISLFRQLFLASNKLKLSDVLSITQNLLMEIASRACHDLTVTPFSDSLVCPKQLSYGSPHIGLESNRQPPTSGLQKLVACGRSTTVKHSTESPPTRTSVRWRSSSHNNDESFDAYQSLNSSRSRTPASRGRCPTSPNPSASRQPPNTSGDNDNDKGGKKPERRNNGRRQSPSPPPNRSGSTTGSKSWKKWMKPDKFNGTGTVETFLAQFDICCSYNS